MIESVKINNNVHFGAINRVKNGHANKSVDNKIVKSEISEVKEKPLLLSAYLQPQKSISFKSQVFTDIPEDWVVQNGAIIEKGGVDSKNKFVDFDKDASKPSFPSAKDLFSSDESKGKIFPFYKVKYSDDRKLPMQNGFLYSNSDGRVTKIDYAFSIPSSKSFDSEKSIDLSDEAYSPTKKQLAILVDFYDKSNEKDLRNELLEKNMFEEPSIQDIHINYLVEDGRYEEALELFPDKTEKINNLENSYQRKNLIDLTDMTDEFDKLLLSGDIFGVLNNYKDNVYKFPNSYRCLSWEEKEDVLKILKDELTFKDSHINEKKKAKKTALDEVLGVSSNTDRFFVALVTAGMSEILYGHKYYTEYGVDVSSKLYGKMKAISDLSGLILSRREEENNEIRKRESEIFLSQKNKYKVKEKIATILIHPVRSYNEEGNRFVPNCVMLQGENPHIMKDIISSLEKVDFVNFTTLPSKRSNEDMQEDLLESLELAEEKYQETKERSIIFVNGMEKLLNPKFNSEENIACMKDILGSASEDYHSTIMFYAKNPEELDKGALMSHRVEYKIDVPVPFEEVERLGGDFEN